jgi:hypothetical protein
MHSITLLTGVELRMGIGESTRRRLKNQITTVWKLTMYYNGYGRYAT